LSVLMCVSCIKRCWCLGGAGAPKHSVSHPPCPWLRCACNDPTTTRLRNSPTSTT